MSRPSNKVQDVGVHPLSRNLQEENPIEELRELTSSKRIASIDFVKGLAMVFIIFAHAAFAWLDFEWRHAYGFMFAFLDILGPSLFVFLSALSVVFSIKRKKKLSSHKAIRNRILVRGLVIMMIGVIFNPMSLMTSGEGGVAFPLNLWGWNILMFVGVSQILSYYALKFSKVARAIFGIIIILISPILRELLYIFKVAPVGEWNFLSVVDILHFIITSPLPQVPLLPFLSICFLSTIFGEMLYEAMIDGSEGAYRKLYKVFLRWGVSLMIIGFILGFRLVTVAATETDFWRTEYLHVQVLRIANQQNFFHYTGILDFMIRGTASNMIYNLGSALLLIAVSFYYLDIKGKSNDVLKMVNFYGKNSLSLFLIQYMFLPLYIGQFPITLIFFALAGYTGFLGYLMYLWLKFFKGVGSPEWIMSQLGKMGQKN
ncbi:MAG: heparan-alpha-glucosaminide N-acetyltransferase domain-containing protein [Promethearchaeota archaeon]